MGAEDWLKIEQVASAVPRRNLCMEMEHRLVPAENPGMWQTCPSSHPPKAKTLFEITTAATLEKSTSTFYV